MTSLAIFDGKPFAVGHDGGRKVERFNSARRNTGKVFGWAWVDLGNFPFAHGSISGYSTVTLGSKLFLFGKALIKIATNLSGL